MDNKEVALELLKLFLEHSRERVELADLVDAYMYIYNVLEGKVPPHEEKEEGTGEKKDEDLLFDFKQPISLSDKEA